MLIGVLPNSCGVWEETRTLNADRSEGHADRSEEYHCACPHKFHADRSVNAKRSEEYKSVALSGPAPVSDGDGKVPNV